MAGLLALGLLGCAATHEADRRIAFRVAQPTSERLQLFERVVEGVRQAGYEPVEANRWLGELTVIARSRSPGRPPPRMRVVCFLDGTIEVQVHERWWRTRVGRLPRLPRGLRRETVELASVLVERLGGASAMSYPLARHRRGQIARRRR
ncbi:MAG TPA: hypothetical protein RMH99_03425 [Sandaracinaceae bacterium LLY-WYZ-13_1]|nr:hypothetical protein [Sandaracinaceae bacterium LLY-WYZ-13_1]